LGAKEGKEKDDFFTTTPMLGGLGSQPQFLELTLILGVWEHEGRKRRVKDDPRRYTKRREGFFKKPRRVIQGFSFTTKEYEETRRF
jgi:hypothetical protein